MTASFAVENAAGYSSDGSTFAQGINPITEKALLLRNLVLAAEFLHSHIIHFFTLAALDYVMGPPMSPWIPYFGDAPSNLTDWDQALTQLNYPDDYQNYFSYYHPALKPGWTGIPNTPLDQSSLISSYNSVIDELNDQQTIWARVIAVYVEALHWKRKCFELASLFSGPQPMWRNLVAGGVALDLSETELQAAIDKYRAILYMGSGSGTVTNPAPGTLADFVYNKYYPLTQILAILYPEYDNSANGGQGIGAGLKNFLGYGVFNSPDAYPEWSEGSFATIDDLLAGPGDVSIDLSSGKRLHKRGYYINGLGDFPLDPEQIVEYIDSSWYVYSDGALYKHPFDGETDPEPTKANAYSWGKSPRIIHTDDNPYAMEVGPLARMWVSGFYREGITYSNDWKCSALGNVSASDIYEIVSGERKDTYACGASVMDRHRARAVEEILLIHMAAAMLDRLELVKGQDSYVYLPLPASTRGFGLNEAPRGALSHWIVVDANSRIENHQAVVPSTWNDSPEAAGSNGPIETAVLSGGQAYVENVNSKLADGTEDLVPLEPIRVIHSFDPCLACTVHVVEKENK